jgi:hypothetical protein
MSRKFKVPLNLVGLTTDPGSATNGDLYFNTVSNKVRYYTQNTWQDLGAAAGGATVQVSTTIPATATEGKLWYDNDDAHLYVFDGTYWVEVSIGPVGPAGPTGAGVATAGTTGQYLVKSSNNNYETTWSTLPAASLTSTDVSRLTGATSNLQTQINTLSTNLGNTLDDYVPIGDVGVADGVASLDSAGKIPIAQLGNLIDGAPAALDTLNELAAAINDDASYAAGITTALGTKISNAGGDIITSSLSSTIPLRIRGAASQTANLLEFQNSSGTAITYVTASGHITAASASISTLYSGGQLSSGTMGYFNATTFAPSVIPIVVRGTTSQTADLQQWQNSAGTVLSAKNAAGQTYIGGNNAIPAGGISRAITAVTFTSTTATYTYTLPSQVVFPGQTVLIAGVTPAGYNGTFTVQSVGGSSGAFTFTCANTTNATVTVATGNFRLSAQLSITASTLDTTPIIVQGATSQVANLQEWMNSSRSTVASIGNGGNITTAGNISTGSYLTNIAFNGVRITPQANTANTLNVGSALIQGNASNQLALTVKQSALSALTITSATANGTTITYTGNTNASFFVAGQTVTITGIVSTGNPSATAGSGFNLIGATIATATSTTFTVTNALVDTYTSGGTATIAAQNADITQWQNFSGTILSRITASGAILSSSVGVFGSQTNTPNAQLFVLSNNAANPATVIKGAVSQTADLQQWENSAGTVLAKITASGALDATAITVNGSAISGGLSPVAVSTNITMVANTRYFVDTANDLTLTLPATPALGAEIELYDASNNAFASDVVILRNGQKINGLTEDAALDINGFTVSFIYTGSTYGWRMK